MNLTLLVAATSAAALTAAPAGFTPTSQTRTLATFAESGGIRGTVTDNDSLAAPDFLPFNASITSFAMAQGVNAPSTAAAAQTSAINSNGVTAEGGVTTIAQCFGCLSQDATASSTLSVSFTIDLILTYTATGSLFTFATPDFPVGFAQATLTGPGGTVFDVVADDYFALPPNLDFSGALIPGSYTLTLTAESNLQGMPEFNQSSFDFELTLASCLADIDLSGAVDGADLGLQLSDWGGNGPGNLNDDLITDGADLGLLLGAWGVCPPLSNCCEGQSTPGCDDPACENAVCAIDPFCCDARWDNICAAEAGDLCAICGGGP